MNDGMNRIITAAGMTTHCGSRRDLRVDSTVWMRVDRAMARMTFSMMAVRRKGVSSVCSFTSPMLGIRKCMPSRNPRATTHMATRARCPMASTLGRFTVQA